MGEFLDKAIIIATNAHKGQTDKGGDDYILHPLRVMIKLDTEDERIIGVLHDVIEDTNTTYDFLREEGFSEKVIEALGCMTRKKEESYMDYIERIKKNQLSSKVKLADLEDNMNISRIKKPTKKDYDRVKKYERAKAILLQ